MSLVHVLLSVLALHPWATLPPDVLPPDVLPPDVLPPPEKTCGAAGHAALQLECTAVAADVLAEAFWAAWTQGWPSLPPVNNTHEIGLRRVLLESVLWLVGASCMIRNPWF